MANYTVAYGWHNTNQTMELESTQCQSKYTLDHYIFCVLKNKIKWNEINPFILVSSKVR